MPMLNMNGPYSFNSEGINAAVPTGTIGNYALGKKDSAGTFRINYVGRSTDVNDRLHQHLNAPSEKRFDITEFKFSKASNEVDAYKKECQNWHDFGGETGQLRNDIHPAKPEGQTNLKCPVCGK